MLLKIAAAATLTAGAGLASMDYVVVDVKADRETPRIVVPIPLLLAQAGVSFVPVEELRMDFDAEAARFLPVAHELVAELRTMPDADIVSVDEGEQQVRVSKRGDHLEVRVESEGHQQVRVNLPLACVEQVLAGVTSGRLDWAGIFAALREAEGALVEVTDGDTRVKISRW